MRAAPGLALLRLTQGRTDAACAAIRRLMSATSDAARARLLPAHSNHACVGDIRTPDAPVMNCGAG